MVLVAIHGNLLNFYLVSHKEKRCKGIARFLQVHITLKVTLCCARHIWCKHRDKPLFSWHPASAQHGQNEQKKNKNKTQMYGKTLSVRLWRHRDEWATWTWPILEKEASWLFVQVFMLLTFRSQDSFRKKYTVQYIIYWPFWKEMTGKSQKTSTFYPYCTINDLTCYYLTHTHTQKMWKSNILKWKMVAAHWKKSCEQMGDATVPHCGCYKYKGTLRQKNP